MQAKLSAPSSNDKGASSKLDITGVLDRDTLSKDYWLEISTAEKAKVIASKLLVVDLLKVERADTSGLAWLINLVKDVSKDQVEVRFLNIPDKLTNLAALSGAEMLLSLQKEAS